MTLPRILITMGDVAGIGPEIIAKAWPRLTERCVPVVVGDAGWLRKALAQAQLNYTVQEVTSLAQVQHGLGIPCMKATAADLSVVVPGEISAAAGQGAYDFLCTAIDLTKAGEADAIVTAPLHKEGLHRAGVKHPGHTEILAERTNVNDFAMVLWGDGIAVAHVTLHMALRNVFEHLTKPNIHEKIRLVHGLLKALDFPQPRVGVAALNPHAGDGGLFGDEEARLIAPAIAQAQAAGIDASGPWPADTLFVRAHAGKFDGIVAMYHDEGHIAMKLRCGPRCVNITVGLPIIRTSVAHGTAYDIAGKNLADPGSLISAVDCARKLAQNGYGK